MSRLPPRAQLERVLNGLGKRLDSQLPGLLAASRFEQERQCLQRLANRDHAAAASAAMSDAEAQWMAELLLERWAAIAGVDLDPIAAISAPAEVWLTRGPRAVPVEVIVEGLDAGWQASWQGDIERGEQAAAEGATATLQVDPPQGAARACARVRVEGRSNGHRRLLVDQVRIPLRVPRLVVSDDRLQVLVRDQLDQPAAGLALRVGATECRTDAAGRITLAEPAAAGVELSIDGLAAGRLPPA